MFEKSQTDDEIIEEIKNCPAKLHYKYKADDLSPLAVVALQKMNLI